MGREIRRVPPHWEHPREDRFISDSGIFCSGKYIKDPEGKFIPLYINFDKDLDDFKKDIKEKGWKEALAYHGGGPNPENYVEYKEEEATWYQVYETVSEGTPVTPPFETKEEIIEYLVENGDFWDQERRSSGDTLMPCDPWSREAAESFVRREWAPSIIADENQIIESCGRDLTK